MLFSNIVNVLGLAAAILSPTIPGCGVISSGVLKVGMIITSTFAAKTVEAASQGYSIKTPLFVVATDAVILTACTYAAVTGLCTGGVAALLALVLTLSNEAMFNTSFIDAKFTEVATA